MKVTLGTFEEVLRLPGRYLNDHCLIRHRQTWHLFGIVGACRATPNAPLEETRFAHATSPDLRRWLVHRDVMHKTGRWPEERMVCAPFVVGNAGRFYMYYDAIDARDGAQWICMAVSRDLFHWRRYPGNPVVAPSLSWAKWPGYTTAGGVSGSCRDPHVIRLGGGRWVMYYTVDLPDRRAAQMVGIAAAVSRDLVHWQDCGPVYRQVQWAPVNGGVRSTESSCVVFKDGLFWLFFTNGYWTNYVTSKDPLGFDGKPLHRLGFAHAAEIFRWRSQWWITHCSSDPANCTYRETNRTRGLFLGRLLWAEHKPPVLV